MTLHPRFRAALGGLCLLAATAALHAQGSPPIATDDPGTPGAGRWEINIGHGTEKRAGSRLTELPVSEFIYGIGERLQVLYAVSYLRLQEDGKPVASGFDNSTVGVKWRFFDGDDRTPAISVHPQLEFNTPGSDADAKGLAGTHTVFLLPFQLEQAVGPVRVIAQIGREFHPEGDAWFYGIAASHRFTEKMEVAAELAGGGSARLSRTSLTANIGVALDLSESTSVMFSIGRELHNHDEPRASLVAYVGVQWRR